MAQLCISDVFAKLACDLPKEAKVKLPKVFLLLTTNPRHPSLGVKKLEGTRQSNLYECRLDRSWRIILQGLEGEMVDLLYVGTHDGVIRLVAVGGVIASSVGKKGRHPAMAPHDALLRRFEQYLAGEDRVLNFISLSANDYQRVGQHAWLSDGYDV
jgi:mRNA interferase RelE/StbE